MGTETPADKSDAPESGDARTRPDDRPPQPRAAGPAALPRARLAPDPGRPRGDRRDPGPVRAGRVHRAVDAPPRVPAGGVDGGARGARGRPGHAHALDDPPGLEDRLPPDGGRDPALSARVAGARPGRPARMASTSTEVAAARPVAARGRSEAPEGAPGRVRRGGLRPAGLGQRRNVGRHGPRPAVGHLGPSPRRPVRAGRGLGRADGRLRGGRARTAAPPLPRGVRAGAAR